MQAGRTFSSSPRAFPGGVGMVPYNTPAPRYRERDPSHGTSQGPHEIYHQLPLPAHSLNTPHAAPPRGFSLARASFRIPRDPAGLGAPRLCCVPRHFSRHN